MKHTGCHPARTQAEEAEKRAQEAEEKVEQVKTRSPPNATQHPVVVPG
jgi:hypothetical protein